MFKFFNFIRNIFLLNKRLAEEEKRQKKEGYLIEFTQHGPERYITYHENEREVAVGADFTYLNDVRLYTNSFVKWDTPKGEKLTPFDYQKILNRLVRYFSCWGGEVILDDAQLQDLEQIKGSLQERGIPFKEIDGVIVYESTIEEEKRSQNSPFF